MSRKGRKQGEKRTAGNSKKDPGVYGEGEAEAEGDVEDYVEDR